MKKTIPNYCTQNEGDCETCSLVNYGRDCQNNMIKREEKTMTIGRDYYHCDYCKKVESGFDRIGIDKHYYSAFCYECQQVMIGSRMNVIRFGNLPKCGQSFNHREKRREIGVSCYLPGMRFRTEFSDRKKKAFSAIIIGWGGDDEPLIDAETII